MKADAKTSMPAGAEDLAALLIDRVRHYERNCRCPKCHVKSCSCVECSFCVANLRKLALAALLPDQSQPVPSSFFPCAGDGSGVTIAAVNKTIGGAAKKKLPAGRAKAKTTPKAGAKKPASRIGKAPAAGLAAKKKPVSIASGRTGPKSGDSDRGLYVRFETPAIKARVMLAAKRNGAPSMNAYIVAATLDWVERNQKLEAPAKEEKETAAAATGT